MGTVPRENRGSPRDSQGKRGQSPKFTVPEIHIYGVELPGGLPEILDPGLLALTFNSVVATWPQSLELRSAGPTSAV